MRNGRRAINKDANQIEPRQLGNGLLACQGMPTTLSLLENIPA